MQDDSKLPPPSQRLREGQAGPNVDPPANLNRVPATSAVPSPAAAPQPVSKDES